MYSSCEAGYMTVQVCHTHSWNTSIWITSENLTSRPPIKSASYQRVPVQQFGPIYVNIENTQRTVIRFGKILEHLFQIGRIQIVQGRKKKVYRLLHYSSVLRFDEAIFSWNIYIYIYITLHKKWTRLNRSCIQTLSMMVRFKKTREYIWSSTKTHKIIHMFTIAYIYRNINFKLSIFSIYVQIHTFWNSRTFDSKNSVAFLWHDFKTLAKRWYNPAWASRPRETTRDVDFGSDGTSPWTIKYTNTYFLYASTAIALIALAGAVIACRMMMMIIMIMNDDRHGGCVYGIENDTYIYIYNMTMVSLEIIESMLYPTIKRNSHASRNRFKPM